MKALCPKMLSENSQIKIVYVLLDGVGDLPHPDIENKTPLQAAKTPNMDKLAKNGKMGEVISVGKGIAPESDIAVFNMLGYNSITQIMQEEELLRQLEQGWISKMVI